MSDRDRRLPGRRAGLRRGRIARGPVGAGNHHISLAGAGSSATKIVDNTIAASITNCGGSSGSVVANGGGVSLMASDASSLRADSGGFAVALAAGLGGGGQGAGTVGCLGLHQHDR